MRYRRADVKGGTYYFTVNMAERNNSLLIDEIDILRSMMNKVKKQHPFKLDAMVVLPDHLHALWTLPIGDNDFATRWMLIKSGFSRAIPKLERINKSRQLKGERGIWQRRYWEHLIRDENDYEQHVDYIHYNPVKHGYVKSATDWTYSSIHMYISKGILSNDWGYNSDGVDCVEFGEKV
jgi:putative transposase